MIGDDDADILVLELCNDILDILDRDRIYPRERLVKKDEFRIYGEGSRYFAASPLSSGKLDSEALAHLRKIELVNEGFKFILALSLGHGGHLHDAQDVVLDAHLPENAGLLWEIADSFLGSFVHRKAGDVLVIEEHSPGIRDYLSGDHVEACCLSRSVRAEKADYFALVNLHGHAFHDGPDSIFLN